MQTILVIEDSPLVLKLLQHQFQQESELQPIFCASLAEAEVVLETFAGQLFAALVDLHLPDAPNGEVVDLVLRYHLPTVVLTATYDEQRREELLLKGVVDYVLKESHSYTYALRLLHRLERNRHIKLLIADDSSATRNFIRRILTPHLYQIVEADDGLEALRILQEQPDIDLLLVDHSMPGLSGFELVKRLRHELKRSELIILGLSADGKGSLSAQFIKQGADDFLRKPFYPEELNCRVMHALDRRDLLRALERAALFDSLTGLLNRRAFTEQCQQVLRKKRTVAVAMLDLDHFKRINDQFGHASGDAALLTFANALRTAFPQALQGRLGGEEFALLSPLLTAEQFSQQLDRFREQLSTLSYSPGAPPLCFSAGVYQGWDDKLENLLRLADDNLYQAKANGRGRTVQLVQAPG